MSNFAAYAFTKALKFSQTTQNVEYDVKYHLPSSLS